jgi:hypothetical protein
VLKGWPVYGDHVADPGNRIDGDHHLHRLRFIPSPRFWTDLEDFVNRALLM